MNEMKGKNRKMARKKSTCIVFYFSGANRCWNGCVCVCAPQSKARKNRRKTKCPDEQVHIGFSIESVSFAQKNVYGVNKKDDKIGKSKWKGARTLTHVDSRLQLQLFSGYESTTSKNVKFPEPQ